MQLIFSPHLTYLELRKVYTGEHTVMMEMKQHVPNVLNVLASISSPAIKGDCEKQIPPLCTSYGILMNCRWKELGLIQKVNGIILGVGGATEKVLYCQ